MANPVAYTYKDVQYPSLSALCAAYGVNRATVSRRLKQGWKLSRAIKTKSYESTGTKIEVAGRTFSSIRLASQFFGIGYECAQRRIRCGWLLEDVFEISKERSSVNGLVYMIYNTINNKKYIGVTVQKLSYRFNGHKQKALSGGKTRLYKAMRKLGVENFRIRVLRSDLTPRQMWRMEKKFIKKYDSIANGYNIKFGGGSFGNQTGRQITVDGQAFKSIKEAASHLGLKTVTLQARIKYNIDLTPPANYLRGNKIQFNGKVFRTQRELAEHLGLSAAALSARLKRGQSLTDPIRPTTNPAGRKGL